MAVIVALSPKHTAGEVTLTVGVGLITTVPKSILLAQVDVIFVITTP